MSSELGWTHLLQKFMSSGLLLKSHKDIAEPAILFPTSDVLSFPNVAARTALRTHTLNDIWVIFP